MAIGYACLVIGEETIKLTSCNLKTATPERLESISRHNLSALDQIIDYNIKNEIKLFRISSDIIPLASHPINKLDWTNLFKEQFDALGKKIKDSGIRVSTHPGQYTVLNSPDDKIVSNAVADLKYHADFMDALNLSSECKIILHVGGVYGDKDTAIERFARNYLSLPPNIKARIIIENDDRSYNIEDVLAISSSLKIPVVFDNLHHKVCPPSIIKSEKDWIQLCSKTWGKKDGKPKIHFSISKSSKEARSHSDTIEALEFYSFYQTIKEENVDIMLEVKDKNISAVKCQNITNSKLHVNKIENEWARYKYYCLSKSANIYREIRELLKSKEDLNNFHLRVQNIINFGVKKSMSTSGCEEANATFTELSSWEKHTLIALRFYELVEFCAKIPEDKGAEVNACEHVWGYFKKVCTPAEKFRFCKLINDYKSDKTKIATVKNFLLRLAKKYDVEYLLKTFYFYL